MNRDKIYLPLILILAVLLLWQWQCRKPKNPEPIVREVVKYVPVFGKDSARKPVPDKVTIPTDKEVNWKTFGYGIVEPGEEIIIPEKDLKPEDYQADSLAYYKAKLEELGRDFFTVREYWDTTETEVGKFWTYKAVGENQLTVYQTFWDFKKQEKEITKDGRTGRFFLGGKVFANTIIQGAEFNAAYETKKGMIYEAGIGEFKGAGTVYSAGVKFKIFGK